MSKMQEFICRREGLKMSNSDKIFRRGLKKSAEDFKKIPLTLLQNFCICVIIREVKQNGQERGVFLKHVVTINKANLKASAEKGGCGKCQSSCQSACKTSCTVANQKCEAER